MHCPYCSVEYTLKEMCFCLPSPFIAAEGDQQPCPEFRLWDAPETFLADPFWCEALTGQPHAMFGLA
jgi:hypothetical protein